MFIYSTKHAIKFIRKDCFYFQLRLFLPLFSLNDETENQVFASLLSVFWAANERKACNFPWHLIPTSDHAISDCSFMIDLSFHINN